MTVHQTSNEGDLALGYETDLEGLTTYYVIEHDVTFRLYDAERAVSLYNHFDKGNN